MSDDDQIPDKHKITQTNADGEEVVIKDPIYDVMSDKELDEATNRLISLIEEDVESRDTEKDANSKQT